MAEPPGPNPPGPGDRDGHAAHPIGPEKVKRSGPAPTQLGPTFVMTTIPAGAHFGDHTQPRPNPSPAGRSDGMSRNVTGTSQATTVTSAVARVILWI